jgi:hypothetical protein
MKFKGIAWWSLGTIDNPLIAISISWENKTLGK